MTNNNSKHLSLVLSIAQMAQALNLSRSRFYQLISEGVFLPPVYSVENKRPFYPQQIAQRNMEARKRNVGINGRVTIFYSQRNRDIIPRPRRKTKINKSKKQSNNQKHAEITEGLLALGLDGIADVQIESALLCCFPDGAENLDQGEILKAVFRYLKRWSSKDNVNR